MALLPILCYPDARLHTVAKPVSVFDHDLEVLAKDMLETMYDSNGIGLAATQVDVHLRLIVMDTSEERQDPWILINPEVTEKSDEMVIAEEGCLSVPGIFDGVERAKEIRVSYLDLKGERHSLHATELIAVCIQHEMDHLLGRVFVEYLSPLKRSRIKNKFLKAQRHNTTP
jgi:peptide deformylase